MVEQQTWMTLLGMAGFTLALFTYLGAMKRDLRAEISDCRSDLKADIADVKADIGRLDGRLTTIEQRTYDLSTRLPPAPTRPTP